MAIAEADGLTQHRVLVASRAARVHALRGDRAAASRLIEGTLDTAHAIREAQAVAPALITTALLCHAEGDDSRVGVLLEELDGYINDNTSPLGDAFRLLAAHDDIDHLGRLIDQMRSGPSSS